MAKKTKTQRNAEMLDNAVGDTGNVTIKMKTAKWIIGILIFCTLSILGVAWGMKSSLEKQMETNNNEIIKKVKSVKDDVKELDDKVDELGKEEVKPNTKTNYDQSADIKILYERTNSRERSVNGYSSRPTHINNTPPTVNFGGVNPIDEDDN